MALARCRSRLRFFPARPTLLSQRKEWNADLEAIDNLISENDARQRAHAGYAARAHMRIPAPAARSHTPSDSSPMASQKRVLSRTCTEARRTARRSASYNRGFLLTGTTARPLGRMPKETNKFEKEYRERSRDSDCPTMSPMSALFSMMKKRVQMPASELDNHASRKSAADMRTSTLVTVSICELAAIPVMRWSSLPSSFARVRRAHEEIPHLSWSAGELVNQVRGQFCQA